MADLLRIEGLRAGYGDTVVLEYRPFDDIAQPTPPPSVTFILAELQAELRDINLFLVNHEIPEIPPEQLILSKIKTLVDGGSQDTVVDKLKDSSLKAAEKAEADDLWPV